jgi:prepilin-type N-terminal cleavage/methylation domain-containing protein
MKKAKGFTLVEMLVVMVILSIILVIIGQFIVDQSTTLRKQQLIANTQQNLRVAAEVMTRDLEMACYNPSRASSDTFGFRTFRPQNVAFTMDLNGDGKVNPAIDTLPKADEYRGFFLYGDTLRRVRGAVGGSFFKFEDIATGVYYLNFTYFDKDSNVVPPGPPPADGGRIARVRFDIRVRSARPYRDTTHIVRSTSSLVVVRNRAF